MVAEWIVALRDEIIDHALQSHRPPVIRGVNPGDTVIHEFLFFFRALAIAEKLLDTTSVPTQEQVLYLLGRMNAPQIATTVLTRYAQFDPSLQPKALELLTQRVEWSTPLLVAINDKSISKDAPNLNQLRRMASFKDETFAKAFKTLYGTIREGRNPDREQVLNQTRDFLKGTPGDPERGIAIYKKEIGRASCRERV